MNKQPLQCFIGLHRIEFTKSSKWARRRSHYLGISVGGHKIGNVWACPKCWKRWKEASKRLKKYQRGLMR